MYQAPAAPQSYSSDSSDDSSSRSSGSRSSRSSAPPGATQCSDAGSGDYSRSGVGNSTTTCSFAANVRSAYLADDNDGNSATITAYSPTTKKSYTMRCVGGSYVTCTGGRNALVYIY